jgi:mono/diheme cytochrome c family protein
MPLSGHDGRVKLDPASFGRIAGWLDLNAQYCGDYSGRDRAEKRAPDPQAESALREHLRANCASCHADLPTQPYAALVNPAQPDESRVLRAVLAADAGGWAQCRRRIDTTSDASYQALLRKVCAASGVIPPEATSLAASASAR